MSAGSRTPIPWLRLLAEGIVVIGSILMAFAIDAWWARRQADALGRELLLRLEAGFEENQRLAEERISAASVDQMLVQRFLAMTPHEAEQITMEAARLSLASDPQLLVALAYWEAELSGLATRNELLYSLSEQITFALARHPELQPSLAAEAVDLPRGLARIAREDNEVMAGAASKARAVVIELQYLDRIEGASAEVLSLVRANLER